jgi:ATP-dependent protease ClpP protease subunit
MAKQKMNRKDVDFIPAGDRINSSLLENHIHFLYGDIEELNTMEAMVWITYENLQSGDYPLTLYIQLDRQVP